MDYPDIPQAVANYVRDRVANARDYDIELGKANGEWLSKVNDVYWYFHGNLKRDEVEGFFPVIHATAAQAQRLDSDYLRRKERRG